MKDIAGEIVDKFKNELNRNFNALAFETLQPMMYLLKREQSLTDFINPLKRLLPKEKNIPRISQRLLVDILMTNSDRFLCRRLTSLLSKRNPVPMLQPPNDTRNQHYRFMSSITHIWDCDRPILFSIGIGKCKGKTALLNALFESSFEQSLNDKYFRGTIDLDFGYHFVERRSVNIADAHGDISIKTINQISMLFSGFLVHVESKHLCSNTSDVINYLKSFHAKSYMLLLIRDVDDENDEAIISAVQDVHSACSYCQTYLLPNVADKSTDESKEKIDELREKIFREAVKLHRQDEKSIQQHLEKLMDNVQQKIVEGDKIYVDRIRQFLINGKECYYPLYSLFTRMCQKRLQLAKMDPYEKNFEGEELYKLHRELFEVDAEFKRKQQMGSQAYGSGFELFLQLLEKPESRLSNLNLLFMELKRERENTAKVERDMPFNFQLSLEIHWRNAVLGWAYSSKVEQEILVNTYQEYMIEGNPFEIVDGDNFEMQGNFLKEVFKLFSKKKFFIVSIIGQQNSGKSTLLNFLFGTSFDVRDGRCTKGKLSF